MNTRKDICSLVNIQIEKWNRIKRYHVFRWWFPSKGKVNKEFQLYEIEELDHILEKNIEIEKKMPQSLDLRSSTLLDDQTPHVWRSTCQSIPRWCFEIEGETFIVVSHGDEEPKSTTETLTCPTKEQ